MAENEKLGKSILLHDYDSSQTVTCTKFFESFYNGNTYYVIEYAGSYAFLDIIDGSWVRIPNKDFELFEKIIFSENQKELDISQLPDVLKYVDPSKKKEPEKVVHNQIFNPTIQKENITKSTMQPINESAEEILISKLKSSIRDLESLIYIGASTNQTPISALGQKLKELSTKLTKEQFEALINKFQSKVSVLEKTIGKGKVPLKTVSELLTTLNTFCARLNMCLNDMDKNRLEGILNQIVQDKSDNLPELPEKIYTKTTPKVEGPKEFILNVYVDTSDKNHYEYYITASEAASLGLASMEEGKDLFEISIKQLLDFEQKFDVQKYDYKSYEKPNTPTPTKTDLQKPEPAIAKNITPFEKLTKLGDEAPKPLEKIGDTQITPGEKAEDVIIKPLTNPVVPEPDENNKLNVIPNKIVVPQKKTDATPLDTREEVEVFITNQGGMYVRPEVAEKYKLTYVMPYLNVYGISEKEYKEKLVYNPTIKIVTINANFPPVELFVDCVVHENEIIYYLDSTAANDIGLNDVDLDNPRKKLTPQEIDLIKNHFKVRAIKREFVVLDTYEPMTAEGIEESRAKLGF